VLRQLVQIQLQYQINASPCVIRENFIKHELSTLILAIPEIFRDFAALAGIEGRFAADFGGSRENLGQFENLLRGCGELERISGNLVKSK